MSKTVIVGCKIPTGLVLQLRDKATPDQVKAQVALQGTMIDMQPFVRENGVGLTNVDEDFWLAWAQWAEANKYAPYVNGFVFAASRPENVKAEAKEKAKEMTKMERLQVPLRPEDGPSKDPRLSDVRSAGIAPIQP